MAPTQLGNFLGQGAFGKVYKAKQNGRDIAVKEIDLGFATELDLDCIVKEINILNNLRHGNIVQYLGAALMDYKTKIHIYMELCDGGDLEARIRKQRPTHFAESKIVPWMCGIARGIEYLHDRQCIHRDIKPPNILLSGETVKIGDFGRGKFFETMQGIYASKGGDLRYMSPEYFTNSKFGTKGDMWSVGCTFYELTVLKPAFQRYQSIMQYKNGKFSLDDIPSIYSDSLRSLINELLLVNPNGRPTASEVIERLTTESSSSESSCVLL